MKQTPHLAMLPSPGMGHIIPMVEFAKKLIFHNQNSLSITLIIPESGLHPAEQKPFLESLSSEPKIDLNYLPKPNLDDFAGSDIATIVNTVPRSLPFINEALKSLVNTKNLVALVVDLFGSAVFEMARGAKIPPYLFFPSNAITLSFFLHLPEIDTSFSGPYKNLPGGRVHLPGCVALRAEELLESCKDRDSFPYKWLVNEGNRYKMAEGIIVNTFQEMENGAINALQQKENFPPIYPIGPLVRTTDNGEDHESNPTMKWLDQQLHGSVLFVSFGSLGSLSQTQLHELALGLEMSEKRFIWVIRDQNSGLASLLPEGFVERTKERGLVVSNWAPQARILAHGSTGGFVTHCGWNSVQESVVNGVPMIAWPLESDQKMIAALLTSQDLKIAMRVSDVLEEGLVVGKNEIAFCVKKLMEGEEGKAVRKQTKAVMEAAKAAVGDGGASTKSLADLVCLWKDRNMTYKITKPLGFEESTA